MASVIKLKNGQYRAQVRIKGHKEVTKQFKTKKEAEKWGHNKEDELITSRPTKNSDLATTKLSISNLIHRLIEEAKAKGQPFRRSKLGALKILNIGIGSISLRDLNEDAIEEYAKKRASGDITGNKVKGATISQELTFLNLVINVAKDVWKIPYNKDPVKAARFKLIYLGLICKADERDRRPTAKEIDEIKQYFSEKNRQKVPMPDIIDFGVATGMRAGEITALRWSDLNEDEKSIIIRDRKHPTKKIGNNQTVPLLNLNGLDAFELIKKQPKNDERIFPYSDGTISSLFPRACRAKKIEDLRFHDMRHEFCSRMGESGKFTIFDIALCSGHRDMNMLKRYVNLTAKSVHNKNNKS